MPRPSSEAAAAPVFQYAGSQIMLVPSENRRSLMIEQSADMIHVGSVDDLDRLIDALTAQRKVFRNGTATAEISCLR